MSMLVLLAAEWSRIIRGDELCRGSRRGDLALSVFRVDR